MLRLENFIRAISWETVAFVLTIRQDNKQGLYLEPSVWREAYDFSQGAVLLVLSSKEYDEADAQR